MDDYTINKEKRMMVKYRFSALIIAALIAIPASFGQSKSSDSAPAPADDASLQESVDLMIMRESSRLDTAEQKLAALAIISTLLEGGSTNDEIRITLERLSLEGTNYQAREKGRIKNDFPEVRRQAARHLGAFNSEEARKALIRVCSSDNEPMVLQEAIRSLGLIGDDTDGEAVGAIVWVATKYHNATAPDNLIAIAAIDALDKIAKNNKNVRQEAFLLLIKISEGSYSPPVREKAKQTIMDVRNIIANSAKEKKQGQPR